MSETRARSICTRFISERQTSRVETHAANKKTPITTRHDLGAREEFDERLELQSTFMLFRFPFHCSNAQNKSDWALAFGVLRVAVCWLLAFIQWDHNRRQQNSTAR
jgi:hypothetical protein